MALLPGICNACLNEDHVTKAGKHVGGFLLGELRLYKSQDKQQLELELKDLLAKKNVTEEDIQSNKNSIAVTYIKLGRLDEAEKILSELRKKYPEDYSITINLGTLYELQGKNAQALEFIKKAVAIDPESHNGSEWFHIKILEFKLRNIPEDEIAGQNILGLYSMNKDASIIGSDVSYQLQERVPFTPAPNILMAKVMQEFGDFMADSISIKGAHVFYEIGMDYDRNNILKLSEKRDALIPYFKKYKEKIPVTGEYYLDISGPANEISKTEAVNSLLEKGLDYLKQQEEKRKTETRQRQFLIFGAVGLCALITGLFFYRRKKQIT